MKLYFCFLCLFLASRFDYVLLDSIDKEVPIIDKDGLDPELVKIDPDYKPPTAIDTAVNSLLLPGPQIVTEVKDEPAEETKTNAAVVEDSQADNNAETHEADSGDKEANIDQNEKEEDTAEVEEANADETEVKVDKTDDKDDGHVPLKEGGDRIMTGNEDWWNDDDQEQDSVTDSPTTVMTPSADDDDDDDHFEEGGDGDDEDGYEYEYEDNDDDHLEQFDEKSSDNKDEYAYDEDDAVQSEGTTVASKDLSNQDTAAAWWEDEYQKSEDDYDYDDANEGYENKKLEDQKVQDGSTTFVTDGWKWPIESMTTSEPYSDGEKEYDSKEAQYDGDYMENKSNAEEVSIDAGKNLLESGSHFDNNIGMLAGTKVQSKSSGPFMMDKASVYIWTLFVTLFLVLLLLFIIWNRKTIERYIVSIRHPTPRTIPNLTQKKMEEEKNLLNHEFV